MDDFEFDEAKSQANLDKHGIDFVAAQGYGKIRIFWNSAQSQTMSQGFCW